MIIFGTHSGKLKSPQTKANDCNYCQTNESVWFYFFQRYIHIFWIPVIPIGKTGSSVCGHCKQVLSVNEMSENQKQEFLKIKKDLKTPFGIQNSSNPTRWIDSVTIFDRIISKHFQIETFLSTINLCHKKRLTPKC